MKKEIPVCLCLTQPRAKARGAGTGWPRPDWGGDSLLPQILRGRLTRAQYEAFSPPLFQPSPEFGGIPTAMPDGADNHFTGFRFDCVINRIRPIQNFSLTGQACGAGKSFRISANLPKNTKDVAGKSLSKPGFSFIIKVNCVGEFSFGSFFNDGPKDHRLARYRFSISATTSSKGRQRSGCLKASSARRSSSAICSGVNSSSNSPNSWRICSTTSCCSSGGNRRICSKISAALMPQKYPNLPRNQAGITCPIDSALRTPHSALR